MEEIKVDLQQLENCAENLHQITNAVENIKGEILNVNNGVGDFWEGEAFEIFRDKNNKLIDSIDNLNDNISKNYKKLIESINIYRETEGMVRTTVDELPTDNIF
ncbi:MAG TPA: hypothetical protein DIW26_01965 [Ruminococcus sp.]|nr:hypothetical protein [Ruminococcus sp.]